MTPDIELGEFNVGDTDRIQFTLKKDGVVWDLTGTAADGITFEFTGPYRDDGSRTTFTRTATIVDPATGGVVRYDTQEGEIDTKGFWNLSVHVRAAGGVVKTYPSPITFYVNDQPSA